MVCHFVEYCSKAFQASPTTNAGSSTAAALPRGPPGSLLRLERALALDQGSAAFTALAEHAGVNRGVCGYVALAVAAHLRARRRPTTRAELALLVEDVRGSALRPEAAALAAWATPVRARRRAYLAAAPAAEFAQQGPLAGHERCAAASGGGGGADGEGGVSGTLPRRQLPFATSERGGPELPPIARRNASLALQRCVK